MGLLGDMFSNPDSAEALGLLGAYMTRGRFGDGLIAANQSLTEAQARAERKKLQDLQYQQGLLTLQKGQREAELEQQIQGAARQNVITPEKAYSLSTGPMPDGSAPPQVQPGFNQKGFIQSLYGVAPLQAMEWEHKLAKDDSPITVAPGASLIDRKTMKPVFQAPEKTETPAAIKEYQFAQQQGYRGTFEQWDRERKKAGASNVSVAVSTEKGFLGSMADKLGGSINDARTAAQSALGTINTVNRIADALDSGKLMAGPGTTFRTYGLQVGQLLGVGGKDAQEKLANTRQAIQGLAQLELDTAGQLKGSGQVSDAERALVKRAAAGDIDSMTPIELRTVLGTADKSARFRIQNYRSQIKPLSQMPNAQVLTPFLNIEEPPPRVGSGAGNVMRFDASGNLITR